MKFGQAKNTTREILFFKLHTENNELGRLEFQTLFFLKKKKKAFLRGRSKWSAAWFQCISIALNLAYNQNKPHKFLDYLSRDILHFDLLE